MMSENLLHLALVEREVEERRYKAGSRSAEMAWHLWAAPKQEREGAPWWRRLRLNLGRLSIQSPARIRRVTTA